MDDSVDVPSLACRLISKLDKGNGRITLSNQNCEDVLLGIGIFTKNNEISKG